MLGLVSAVLVYAVLRRYNVRPWIATAATVTVLFDPGQLILEQIVLADLLAMVLMVIAFCVLLLARDKPSVLRVVIAGLLMGASATVRPTTLPLILFLAIYLLVTRAGWLRAGAALLAGVLPIVAYMGWFASVYGSFNFTNSNGLFLWSRTMTFANCAKINPPADLRPLCPENQPRQQALPAGSGRLLPKIYLWDHTAWMWTDPAAGPKGVRPDTQAFTKANNERALRFALAAIKAQPLSYAHAVADDLTTIFTSKDVFLFPGRQPVLQGLGPLNKRYALAAVQAYAGSTKGIGPYLGRHFGVRLHQPFAHWVRIYQTYVFMPGPLFAAARRGRPGRPADTAPPDRGGRAAVDLRRGDSDPAGRRARVHLPVRDTRPAAALHDAGAGARARSPGREAARPWPVPAPGPRGRRGGR